MKTVLLVPGFQEDITTRDYKSVLDSIQSKGYDVKFVPIQWKRTTIDDWVAELEAEYYKHDPKNTILAGFSYGSMTAFVAATKRLPAELWLFSFSPYFSDDLPKLKKSWKDGIGHRRVTAFSKLDFDHLAKSITCPTLIVLGSVEADKYPHMVTRAHIAKERIKNSRYIIAGGADHDIADTKYIKTIGSAIG